MKYKLKQYEEEEGEPIKVYLCHLPDDYFDAFIKNTRAAHGVEVGRAKFNQKVDNISEALALCFNWAASREGATFWSMVEQAMRRGETLPPYEIMLSESKLESKWIGPVKADSMKNHVGEIEDCVNEEDRTPLSINQLTEMSKGPNGVDMSKYRLAKDDEIPKVIGNPQNQSNIGVREIRKFNLSEVSVCEKGIEIGGTVCKCNTCKSTDKEISEGNCIDCWQQLAMKSKAFEDLADEIYHALYPIKNTCHLRARIDAVKSRFVEGE